MPKGGKEVIVVSVLVIDDDNQFRTFVREVLEAEGYDVREAANGEEGVKAYRQRPADLVLCDIFMPEKDGLQTIRELHHEFGKAKIVAISGGGCCLSQADFLPLAKEFGAVAGLDKPVKSSTLMGTLKQILAA